MREVVTRDAILSESGTDAHRSTYRQPALARLGLLADVTRTIGCLSSATKDGPPGGGCHTKTR